MPRAEEATGPRDAIEVGMAVRCGGVKRCGLLVVSWRSAKTTTATTWWQSKHRAWGGSGRGRVRPLQLRARRGQQAGAFGQRHARSSSSKIEGQGSGH
nr:unnamed protein product [Digitaria exilis]